MDKANDALSPWGLQRVVPNAVAVDPAFTAPPANYSGGAISTAAIVGANGVYEVYVAAGNPGEPLPAAQAAAVVDALGIAPPGGVSVLRFTTSDFVSWSQPLLSLFLAVGSGGPKGTDWTVKSIDRDPSTGLYVMLVAYGGEELHAFSAKDVTQANAFTPTSGSLNTPSFKDHDDSNIIFDVVRRTWVDMQIMYENRTVQGLGPKPFCDNQANETRRVVSTRVSADGVKWTQDQGCLDRPQDGKCKVFNNSGMVRPDPDLDAPELEFYRIRPFYLGSSGRIAALVLLYAPAPSIMQFGHMAQQYGRWPAPSCVPGTECCHGPHVYEEWWIGPADGDPTNMGGWTRMRDFEAGPHDAWLMEQPLTFSDKHLWVDNGVVYSLPLYRLAGMYSAFNAAFTTQPFAYPAAGLWLNADAQWPGYTVEGGSDEGHAAYVLYELQDAATGKALPGFESDRANVLMNATALRFPLEWSGGPAVPAPGTPVQLRILHRRARIYALGTGA